MQELGLKVMNEKLMYDVLSVPSYTGMEYRMIDYLIRHAKEKGYICKTDEKENIYLSKGVLPEGGFYPCLTAHMDTVQLKQVPFINENKSQSLMTEESEGMHKIYSKGFGLGGDDKAGIAVALSIMEQLPVCKAVFFVEEEQGCCGSRAADFSWFKDVGYIIAFDAPGFNCASKSCYGVNLFNQSFYNTYLAELGPKFGLTNFFAHPFTDVMVLREETSLACMNYGAGYHNYHTPDEYCIAEEMDNAASLGIYLINRLGLRSIIVKERDVKATRNYLHTKSFYQLWPLP